MNASPQGFLTVECPHSLNNSPRGSPRSSPRASLLNANEAMPSPHNTSRRCSWRQPELEPLLHGRLGNPDLRAVEAPPANLGHPSPPHGLWSDAAAPPDVSGSTANITNSTLPTPPPERQASIVDHVDDGGTSAGGPDDDYADSIAPELVDELVAAKVPEHNWRRGIARVHHTTVLYKKQLFLYGGDRDEGETSTRGAEGLPNIPDMFFRYSTDKQRWAAQSDANWKRGRARREGHTAVVYKNCMYVFGGHKKSAFVTDFAMYELETGQWLKADEVNPDTVSPRFGHAAVVANDRMWVVGGFLRDDSPSALASYSFMYQTWEHHMHPPGLPRNTQTSPVAVAYKNELYVLGLFAKAQKATDIAAYDMGLGRWREIACGGIRADLEWFRGTLPTYAAPAYIAQHQRLILFTSRPLVRRASKPIAAGGGNKRKERDMIAPVVYSLDLRRNRWSEVKVLGIPLPACYDSGHFVTKYATAVAGDTIHIVGGLNEEYINMTLAFRVREEYRAAEGESMFEFMTHWQAAKDQQDAQPTCVPFKKEVSLPIQLLCDLGAPLIKLRGADVRTWETCVYAGERRWLVDEYDRSRQRPPAALRTAVRMEAARDTPAAAAAQRATSPTERDATQPGGAMTSGDALLSIESESTIPPRFATLGHPRPLVRAKPPVENEATLRMGGDVLVPRSALVRAPIMSSSTSSSSAGRSSFGFPLSPASTGTELIPPTPPPKRGKRGAKIRAHTMSSDLSDGFSPCKSSGSMRSPDASSVGFCVSAGGVAETGASSPSQVSIPLATPRGVVAPPHPEWRCSQKKQVILQLYAQNDSQSALALRSVLTSLSTMGTAPAPPPPDEVRACVHLSRTIKDPHMTRHEEELSGAGGEEDVEAVRALTTHDLSKLPIPVPPALERERLDLPEETVTEDEEEDEGRKGGGLTLMVPGSPTAARRRSSGGESTMVGTPASALGGRDLVKSALLATYGKRWTRRVASSRKSSVGRGGGTTPTAMRRLPLGAMGLVPRSPMAAAEGNMPQAGFMRVVSDLPSEWGGGSSGGGGGMAPTTNHLASWIRNGLTTPRMSPRARAGEGGGLSPHAQRPRGASQASSRPRSPLSLSSGRWGRVGDMVRMASVADYLAAAGKDAKDIPATSFPVSPTSSAVAEPVLDFSFSGLLTPLTPGVRAPSTPPTAAAQREPPRPMVKAAKWRKEVGLHLPGYSTSTPAAQRQPRRSVFEGIVPPG